MRGAYTPIIGDYAVDCAICASRGTSSEMVPIRLAVPGNPPTEMLAHRECADEPTPRANRPRPRQVIAPRRVQALTWEGLASTSTPTITATSRSGNTLTLTGTNFDTTTRARVDGKNRVFTRISTTSAQVALSADDVLVGQHTVQVWHLRPPSDGSAAYSSIVTWTVE